MTVSIVSSAAALMAALGQAQAGDIIALKPGNYGTINIDSANFSSHVVIESASKLQPATISGLNVSNSGNLIFSGLNIRGTGANVWYYANVTQSHDIRFVNDSFNGSDASNLNDDAGGLNVQASQNILVFGSTFSNLTTGISEGSNNYIWIKSNNFTNIQSDGIDNAGSSWVNIVGNYFTSFHPTATEHPDGVQFWTEGTTSSAHNIYIAENTVVRGDGATVQGIFVQDDSGNLPYLSLQIANNQVIGEGYNGIAVQGSVGALVSGNVVQPYSDVESWIEIENSQNGKLENNSAGSYVLTTNLNLKNTGNSILSAANVPGGPNARATSVAPLAPDATSPIDRGPSASLSASDLVAGMNGSHTAQFLIIAMAGFGDSPASRLYIPVATSTGANQLAQPIA